MIMILEAILLEIPMPIQVKAILSMIVTMKLLMWVVMTIILKKMMRSSSYKMTLKVL